jgi:hypothetical protein
MRTGAGVPGRPSWRTRLVQPVCPRSPTKQPLAQCERALVSPAEHTLGQDQPRERCTGERGLPQLPTRALIVNRCRTHAGFGQLDPPAVHYLVVGRRRHRNGPAEMIRNAQTHVAKYPPAPPRGDELVSRAEPPVLLAQSDTEQTVRDDARTSSQASVWGLTSLPLAAHADAIAGWNSMHLAAASASGRSPPKCGRSSHPHRPKPTPQRDRARWPPFAGCPTESRPTTAVPGSHPASDGGRSCTHRHIERG